MIIQMVEKCSNISTKYNYFKDTTDNLKFIIEGVQFEKSQTSNRIIQIILATFTGLSLYSVITDVINLLVMNQINLESNIPTKSIILSLATVIIFLFLYIIGKRS